MAMPELPNHPHAKMLDTYRKKRPRLLRWIVYAALSIVGLLVFVFLLGLVVGKPKSDDVTTLVQEAQARGLIADANPHLMAVGVLGAVAAFDSARRSAKIDVSTDELAATVGEWVDKALRAP